MSRFLIHPNDIVENRFELRGSEAHHALHVMRLKVGDPISLFDGADHSFQGIIDAVSSDHLSGHLIQAKSERSWPVQVTIYQALLRGSKWDWFLEKAGEIGAVRVVPILSRRTLVKWESSETQKVDRWNRIALAASKQSGRTDLLQVTAPISVQGALQTLSKTGIHLIPWEKEEKASIRSVLQNRKSGVHAVSIFIGPEGGWEADEIKLAQAAGVIPVRLGPTLLRTETAALVAATLVLREFGLY